MLFALVATMVHRLREQTKAVMKSHQPDVEKALSQIDDFMMVVKWEFHSWGMCFERKWNFENFVQHHLQIAADDIVLILQCPWYPGFYLVTPATYTKKDPAFGKQVCFR